MSFASLSALATRGRLTAGAVSGVLVLGAMAGTGVAVAKIPSSSTGQITACVAKPSGTTRIINAQKGKKCRAGEKTISWSRGWSYRGGWRSTTSYKVGDVVLSGGTSYLARKRSKAAKPGVATTVWVPLSTAGANGASGAVGATGAQGLKGADGATGATGAQGLKGDAGTNGRTEPTAPTGAAGPQGLSAYELAVSGQLLPPALPDWLLSLKGDEGRPRPEGRPGRAGPPGRPPARRATEGLQGLRATPARRATRACRASRATPARRATRADRASRATRARRATRATEVPRESKAFRAPPAQMAPTDATAHTLCKPCVRPCHRAAARLLPAPRLPISWSAAAATWSAAAAH